MYQYMLEPGQLDISFAGKNPGDPGGHPVAHEPAMNLRRSTASWMALGKALLAGQGV